MLLVFPFYRGNENREGKWFTQGQKAGERQGQDSNSAPSDVRALVRALML